MAKAALLKLENIASQIHFIRGEKVLLDFDLATMYQVETRALKQQVRRNIDRFPEDFMFQLSSDEWKELVTKSDNLQSQKFSPTQPFAFTEQGVAMLSTVLRSKKAVEVNIAVMRTFVQIRKLMEGNKALETKILALEQKYDEKFDLVFAVIEKLVEEEVAEREPVGYKLPRKKK